MTRTIKMGNKKITVVTEQDVQAVVTSDDAEMDMRVKEAVKSEIDRARICKKPVAKYDRESKRAYLQLLDGEKRFII